MILLTHVHKLGNIQTNVTSLMNGNYIHSSGKKVKWTNKLKPVVVDPFTAPTGPTLTLPTSPIATFLLFFTESFFEMIVVETNRYAQTCMGEEEFIKWTNVTIDELTLLYYIISYYIVLYYIILYCIILYCCTGIEKWP